MTFEIWWKNYKVNAKEITIDNIADIQRMIAKDAWEAGWEAAYEEVEEAERYDSI